MEFGNKYRWETAHVSGLVQEIVRYVSQGYFFYVKAEIPERKDPTAVDRKLIEGYGLAVSKWARARRKRAGKANLCYLRHGRTFVLMATAGEHLFFRREAGAIRDVRKDPLQIGGYAIGAILGSDGRWHTDTSIAEPQYRRLKAYLREAAVKVPIAEIGRELRELPFEPWGGVKTQFRALRRAAEKARRSAGLNPWRISDSYLRLARRPLRAFEKCSCEGE